MSFLKVVLFSSLCFLWTSLVFSQTGNEKTNSEEKGIITPYTVENGDTLLLSLLPVATVKAKGTPNYRKTRKYKKTLKRVRKVYPYAILGAKMYDDYLAKAESFETNKAKRKYLKEEEKRLKEKFEGQVRNITISEGVILVKLIDRETSQTGYNVLKDVKGGGSAFLWQGIARLFSSSLKHEYDPSGEDWMIEEIVERILNGEISVGEIQD